MSRKLARLLTTTLRLNAPAPTDAARWRGPLPATFIKVIADQGASTWLLRRLDALGLLASVPPEPAGALRSQAQRHAAWNSMVDAETERVCDRLSSMGVPFVLLKGVARRALAPLIPYADARLTTDVDVLVPEHAAGEAWQAFSADGYTRGSGWEPAGGRHYHLAALLSPERVGVELHVSTTLAWPPDEAWHQLHGTARWVDWRGRRVMVPSDTELMSQAMSKAMRESATGYTLRYFLDAAVLLAAPDAKIDWNVLEQRMTSGHLANAGREFPWLNAAKMLAEGAHAAVPGGDAPAFPLDQVLGWHIRVARIFDRLPRVRGTAADAATRLEAGLAFWEPYYGKGGKRRRIVEGISRAAYAGWRRFG